MNIELGSEMQDLSPREIEATMRHFVNLNVKRDRVLHALATAIRGAKAECISITVSEKLTREMPMLFASGKLMGVPVFTHPEVTGYNVELAFAEHCQGQEPPRESTEGAG